VHTQLRCNDRLAIERLQLADFRDCQQSLLLKGTKTHARITGLLYIWGEYKQVFDSRVCTDEVISMMKREHKATHAAVMTCCYDWLIW
jgi:hypothetical protein